jgi:hypothetical protein
MELFLCPILYCKFFPQKFQKHVPISFFEINLLFMSSYLSVPFWVAPPRTDMKSFELERLVRNNLDWCDEHYLRKSSIEKEHYNYPIWQNNTFSSILTKRKLPDEIVKGACQKKCVITIHYPKKADFRMSEMGASPPSRKIPERC